MKQTLLILALGLLLLNAVSAQQTTPTPKIEQDDEDVVKISTVLVQIDVTVTDKSGNIVKDLRPEEFEIYENQAKQTITNFSFIQSENKAAKNPTVGNTTLKENLPLPPAKIKLENVRRTIAFVVDDLTLDFDGIHFTKKALKKFVDEQMQEGDLVAIVLVSAGIGTLQQFTTDKRQLYAAIKNIRWKPLFSREFGRFDSLTENSDQQSSNAERDLKNAEDEYNDFQKSVLRVASLGATDYVVNGMKRLPGRKSIMFISDKLSLKTRDYRKDERTLKALRSLIESANRAAVVIYTMNAEGMPFAEREFTAESNSYPSVYEEEGGKLQKILGNRQEQIFDKIRDREGLERLALETGGLAIINRKDLNLNIQKMLDDQKGYYLIGYQPDAETFNPEKLRYNFLTVKVKRPDVSVRYRSGFFGVEKSKEAATEISPSKQLNDALTSPFAENDLNVHLAALFGSDAKGSFVRSFVYIPTKDLTFTDEPDGWKKATFDIAVLASSEDGVPVVKSGKSNSFRISPENYKKISDTGFIYNFDMQVKEPGAYNLRVALRDEISKKIGSASQFVEVPNLEKNRLALSGITLGNFTPEEWRQFQSTAASNDTLKAKNDTAFRKFKQNTVLSFSLTAYNAKLDKTTKQPSLQSRVRIFRDGKVIFEGSPKPVELQVQKDFERVNINGAISLGEQMQPGEYVLQIIVTDTLAKGKNTLSAQWIDLEVIR